MAAADRQVGHLRLRAADPQDVSALLPRLEDGLRCATLPDAGGRLFLVRRVDLGCIPRDASPQMLSHLIEQRVAAAGGSWSEGGSPGAAHANCVAFPDRLVARTRLAARLIRGIEARDWYWRLAVPEFRPDARLADNLRAMAWSIADWPEASVALPSWTACLAEDGGAARLIAAISGDEGAALIQRAGLAAAGVAGGSASKGSSPSLDGLPAPTLDGLPAPTLGDSAHAPPPGWLAALLQATRSAATRLRPPPHAARAASTGLPASVSAPATAGRLSQPLRRTASPQENARSSMTQGRRIRGESSCPISTCEAPPAIARPPMNRPVIATESSATEAWLAPTVAGGLLFLLHVLARLGIAECIERLGDDGRGFAARVCAAALRRLPAAPGDAFWPIVAPALPPGRLSDPGDPPSPWKTDELAPPKGRRSSGALEQAWQRAADLDALAELWLLAARRWLRRVSGIGLASLISRPARLGATMTHIDVHFRLNDVDLRVRRAGLDLDPGWVPWFGYVVAFHFDAGGFA